MQASVAQLDATCDQEVVGSTATVSATFFCGDWSWNIFYGQSLDSADSRRAGQFLAKECAQYYIED